MLAGAPGPRCSALLCREAGGGGSAPRPLRGPSVGMIPDRPEPEGEVTGGKDLKSLPCSRPLGLLAL